MAGTPTENKNRIDYEEKSFHHIYNIFAAKIQSLFQRLQEERCGKNGRGGQEQDPDGGVTVLQTSGSKDFGNSESLSVLQC